MATDTLVENEMFIWLSNSQHFLVYLSTDSLGITDDDSQQSFLPGSEHSAKSI